MIVCSRTPRYKSRHCDKRINELERELDGLLFKRSQLGYELSSLGERLLKHAVSIEQETKLIASVAREESHGLGGRIVISCPENDMVNVFPAINDFLAGYPRITIELNTTLVPVDLNKKETDIAIRMTNDPPENTIGRKVANVEWGILQVRAISTKVSIQKIYQL